MSILEMVLQTGQRTPAPGNAGMSLILGAVGAVSVLLVTVGIFYVLIKLGRFLDAMKDKA